MKTVEQHIAEILERNTKFANYSITKVFDTEKIGKRWRRALSYFCTLCEESRTMQVSDAKSGRGCAGCRNKLATEAAGNACRYSEKEIIKLIEVGSICKFLSFPDGYTNVKDRVEVECNTCEHIWYPKVTSRVHFNQGCPECDEFNHGRYRTHAFI